MPGAPSMLRPAQRQMKKINSATVIIRKMPPRIPFGGVSPSSLRPNQSSPPAMPSWTTSRSATSTKLFDMYGVMLSFQMVGTA